MSDRRQIGIGTLGSILGLLLSSVPEIWGQTQTVLAEERGASGTVTMWKQPLDEVNAKIWFEVKGADSHQSVKIPYDEYYCGDRLSTGMKGRRFVAAFMAVQNAGHIVVIDVPTATMIKDELAKAPEVSPDSRLVVYGEWRPPRYPYLAYPGPLTVMEVMKPDMPTFQVFILDQDPEGYSDHGIEQELLWSRDSKRFYFLDTYYGEGEMQYWATFDLSNGVENPRHVFQPLSSAQYSAKGMEGLFFQFHNLRWSDAHSIRFDLVPEFRRSNDGWRARTCEFRCFDLRQERSAVDPNTIPTEAIYWASVFEGGLRPTDEVHRDEQGKLRLKRDRVAMKAERMATDQAGNRYARIWGFQACEQMGIASALPAARKVVETGRGTPPLTAAAVGLIGAVGSADDVKLLQSVLDGTPTARLETAVKKALSKLKKQD